MKPDLSVVIPCYNCEKTLIEAVESCYTQGLATERFEIIMVNDGSTDGTQALIERIASERDNARHVFHERNLGGGAARNTGIRAAKGELIYCLDSDNVLDKGSLKLLSEYLRGKGADGVAFYERRFFSGNDLKSYSPMRAEVLDRPVSLSDIFAEPSVLLDNFLFTKESYLKTKGYPEHHGFDTQCFEMRYLKSGGEVWICPDSTFYHRQLAHTESYFEREYNKGNFSLFYFYCIEDIFELLQPDAQEFIARYDIFNKSSLEDNLLNELKRLHKEGLLFVPDEKGDNRVLDFAKGVLLYRDRRYGEAADMFKSALDSGLKTPVVYYCLARCQMALSGVVERRLVERKTAESRPEFQTRSRRLHRKIDRIPLFRRVRTVLNSLKKWHRR